MGWFPRFLKYFWIKIIFLKIQKKFFSQRKIKNQRSPKNLGKQDKKACNPCFPAFFSFLVYILHFPPGCGGKNDDRRQWDEEPQRNDAKYSFIYFSLHFCWWKGFPSGKWVRSDGKFWKIKFYSRKKFFFWIFRNFWNFRQILMDLLNFLVIFNDFLKIWSEFNEKMAKNGRRKWKIRE